jgi:hypothetical protein
MELKFITAFKIAAICPYPEPIPKDELKSEEFIVTANLKWLFI